jgi:hypothetical protein
MNILIFSASVTCYTTEVYLHVERVIWMRSGDSELTYWQCCILYEGHDVLGGMEFIQYIP